MSVRGVPAQHLETPQRPFATKADVAAQRPAAMLVEMPGQDHAPIPHKSLFSLIFSEQF
jgi:hypothetical protein